MQFPSGPILYEFDDSALDAVLASTPIDYCHFLVGKVIEDMDGFGWGDVAKEVGRGGSDGEFALLDEFAGVGVVGGSDSHEAGLGGDYHGEDLEVGF